MPQKHGPAWTQSPKLGSLDSRRHSGTSHTFPQMFFFLIFLLRSHSFLPFFLSSFLSSSLFPHSKMGYALETSIKGSNGLCSWAVKGIPAARRNKENANQIKADIITSVKVICIRVDPTNSVEETDRPKHYVASLNSDTNILMGVMNLSDVQTPTSGYPEKIKSALSSIVLRAMQTTALSPIHKTEIPNYIKAMGVETIPCSINMDSFLSSNEFNALSTKDREERVQRLGGCLKFVLKGIVTQSKKDSEFKDCASSRVGSISIGYDPTSSICYEARNTRTKVTWTAELLTAPASEAEGGATTMHLSLVRNVSLYCPLLFLLLNRLTH